MGCVSLRLSRQFADGVGVDAVCALELEPGADETIRYPVPFTLR